MTRAYAKAKIAERVACLLIDLHQWTGRFVFMEVASRVLGWGEVFGPPLPPSEEGEETF